VLQSDQPMHPSMSSLQALPPGLIAVTGGERTGKTSLLRRLRGCEKIKNRSEGPSEGVKSRHELSGAL